MTKANHTSESEPCCNVIFPCNSGKKYIMEEKLTPTTPLKAIREKCIDCSGGSKKEVRLCWASNCPLYPFRMGKNPYRKKRKVAETQKSDLLKRLKQ